MNLKKNLKKNNLKNSLDDLCKQTPQVNTFTMNKNPAILSSRSHTPKPFENLQKRLRFCQRVTFEI